VDPEETFGQWPNLVAMFFQRAAEQPRRPFLWARDDSTFRSLSWAETERQIIALARALRDFGIEDGDRVVLVSENRPEWLIADVAIMATGGITVPAYTTNTEDDHAHILTNSGAKGAIVSTRRLAEQFLPAAITAPDLAFAICIEAPDISQNIGVAIHSWHEALARGDELSGDVRDWARALVPDDVACIIYTSGTSGAPKGVMLTHRNITCNVVGARDTLKELGIGHEVFLSFLPLSHAYEHSGGQFFPMSLGAEIYYCRKLERLPSDLRVARPTIMTAVPRLYETMHARIMRDVVRKGGLKAKLFLKTVELGRERFENNGRLPFGNSVLDFVLDLLVRRKIRDRFGGRLKALVSGGAPLNPDIGLFFTALGLRLLQGYGQTEAGPVISVNRPSNVRLDTVGPPMKGVEVKVAVDGEILVRGDLVMKGYWRNPTATAEVLKDGWLYTGDLGTVDADGHLRITDRKKDLIITSHGDNISPQRIEGFLTLEPEIAQAMVHGDRLPFLVALIVPDEEWARSWAAAAGKPANLAELVADEAFRIAVAAAVERVNRDLSKIERVRRHALIAEPFTVENEMLTPTMKVRRHKVWATHGTTLQQMYAGRRSLPHQSPPDG
jgi:long-chain acyl-CoA synthetase